MVTEFRVRGDVLKSELTMLILNRGAGERRDGGPGVGIGPCRRAASAGVDAAAAAYVPPGNL